MSVVPSVRVCAGYQLLHYLGNESPRKVHPALEPHVQCQIRSEYLHVVDEIKEGPRQCYEVLPPRTSRIPASQRPPGFRYGRQRLSNLLE